VPKGVFNCVTGSARRSGGEITDNPIVRKVTFTGSTEIGKLLMAQCAATVKKTSMELAGNAPSRLRRRPISTPQSGRVASKYRNAGQTCVCANRILVQDGVYDAFAKKLGRVRVDEGRQRHRAGRRHRPADRHEAVEKVEHHIADAVKKGAKVVVGGKRHALGGSFFEPTVLANVTHRHGVTREETFGPVAPLSRFKTEARRSGWRTTPSSGSPPTSTAATIGRVWRVAEALEYGIVGITRASSRPRSPRSAASRRAASAARARNTASRNSSR